MIVSTIKYYKESFRGLSREIWLLSLIMLINRSGMMVIPFLTLYATQELGFSVVRAGMLTASFGLGSIAGSWLGGWLTDRWGTYRVMSYSLLLGGAGLIFLGFIKSYWLLMLAIFIVSTIADALRPAVMSSINNYSDPENRTRSISLIRMAINLGISIGPAVGGIVAGSLGYVWLFVLDGLTCLLAAFFLLKLLPEKSDEKELDVADTESAPSQSAYKDYVFMAFVFVNLINLIAFFQILSTVPLYFEQEWNLTEFQIGLFFTLNGLIIFLFEMPVIFYTENIRRSFFWVIVGAFMIGLAHAAFLLPGYWLILFLAYSFLVGFGEILNFPYSNTWALKRGSRGSLGQYMGAYTMMFSIGFLVAPILGTQILDAFGFNVLWSSMAAMNLISVIGFLVIRNKIQD